jgi:hypothetical protein
MITVGLNLKDTDNLSPSTPKDSYRTRQSKKNSSRCSIVGINGKIDPLSEYDEVDEEVILLNRSLQIWRNFTEILTGSWIDLLRTEMTN